MANNYQEGINRAKKEIDELQVKLVKMQGTILENAKSFNAMLSKGGGSMKEVQATVANVTTGYRKLNEEKERAIVIDGKIKVKQSELAKNMQSLNAQKEKEARSITKVNRARIKEIDKIEKNKQALLKQKAAANELSRAYVQLVSRQQKAKKTLQDLIVSQGKNSKATRKAQKDYDRLSKKVNMANKATSNFAKNGLGSAVRGFKNLLGAFGIIGGLQLLSSVGKEVFTLTREINSMAFSIRAVIKDATELAQTQEWLKNITNAYGADIVSTTKRYIKFRAASKEANLTASETQKIFGTVTKAAGVLGLKTDELTGIYLALEQMISKGKVTTEELRRQLGERLPGAFDIMAKAVGVSSSELDKMLRAGEILSNEALPKFVVQLEKAYGIESVTKVDTMVAAQIRMNNAWKNLVISIEEDSGMISNFFKTQFQDIADFLQQIEKLNKSQDNLMSENRASEYTRSLTSIKDEWKEILDHNEQMVDFGKSIKIEKGDYLKFLNKEKDKQAEIVRLKSREVNQLNSKRKRLEDINSLLPTAGTEKGRLLNEKNKLKISIKELEVKERLLFAEKGRLDAFKELIKLEEKPKKDKDGKKEEENNKKKINYLKNSLTYFKKQISLAEANLANTALTKEEYEKGEEAIKKAEDALDSFIRKMKGIPNKGGVFGVMLKDIGAVETILNDIDNEKVEIPIDTSKLDEAYEKLVVLNIAKDAFFKVTETFSEVFDIDTSKFNFIFDELQKNFDGIDETASELFSAENIGAWADLSKELIGSVLDASLMRYEVELQTAQRVRDQILNDDLATEEQKEAARKKFEEKERKIKTEMAKKERENTLIKIAMDTAAAVMSIWAQVPKFDFGISAGIMTAATISLGAAQAALVASQPLPKFEMGTDNAPEGWAITQERNPEPIVDRHGNLKTMGSMGGDSLTYLNKGDRVFKNQDEFFKEFDLDNINRSVFDMNMSSNGKVLSQNIVDKALLREVGGLRSDIDKMGKRIEKMASRPINVQNEVKLEDNRHY